MTSNDDPYRPPRSPFDLGATFDPFRNTTLVVSLGVARFGRADGESVFLTLCLGDMLATQRDGEQDHADVLTLNGCFIAYTVVHRADPTQDGKVLASAPTRRIVTLRLVSEGCALVRPGS